MAGPWEKFQKTEPVAGPWTKFAPQAETPVQTTSPMEDKSYSGSILPFSRDAAGNVSFDSDAGILGVAKRAFMAPGDAYRGELQLTDAAGQPTQEAIGRSLDFASTFSPAAVGIRSGEGIIPGIAKQMERTKPPVPTADELAAEAARGFKAMRETGVDYSSGAVKKFAEAVKRSLEEDGFDAEVAGRTHRILDKLANPPEDSVASIKGLHSARKTFGKIGQNFNDPTDQAAASQAIRGLDEFISTADPSSVVAGTPADAASFLRQANANFAAGKRSDMLNGIERAADLRAAAANSGANTGNAIRQRIVSSLLQPKQTSGFSPEEVAALEKIATGTLAQNATRHVGNLFGGGGGLGQAFAALAGALGGGAVGGVEGATVGAALPAGVGVVSKGLSNRLTQKALSRADEMVRMRSPLYEQRAAAAPSEVVRKMETEALIRAIMMSGTRSNGGGGW